MHRPIDQAAVHAPVTSSCPALATRIDRQIEARSLPPEAQTIAPERSGFAVGFERPDARRWTTTEVPRRSGSAERSAAAVCRTRSPERPRSPLVSSRWRQEYVPAGVAVAVGRRPLHVPGGARSRAPVKPHRRTSGVRHDRRFGRDGRRCPGVGSSKAFGRDARRPSPQRAEAPRLRRRHSRSVARTRRVGDEPAQVDALHGRSDPDALRPRPDRHPHRVARVREMSPASVVALTWSTMRCEPPTRGPESSTRLRLPRHSLAQ